MRRRGTSRSGRRGFVGRRAFSKSVNAIVEKRLTSSNFYSNNGTGVVKTISNQQNYLLGECMMDTGTLDIICESIQSSSLTGKFTVRSYSTERRITNATQAGKVWLTAYRCIARKDIPSSQSIDNLITQGFTQLDNTGPGAARMVYTAVGTTLFQNPAFCQYFRIKRVKKICLEPGQYFVDKHVFRGAKKFNELRYKSAGSAGSSGVNLTAMKGWGVSVWFFHGQVVEDATNADVVGWGPCQLSYERFRKVDYTWVDDRSTAGTYDQAGAGVITTAKVINEMTGDIDEMKEDD